METLTNCPLCNTHLPVNPYITAQDHLVSGKTFNIIRCDNCMLLLTNPRPGTNEIDHYYQSEAYISHTDKRRSLHDFLYHKIKSIMLKRKVGLLKKHTTKKNAKVLDFGCGTGSFLKATAKAGLQAEGFEPGEIANTTAKAKGLKVFTRPDELFINQTKKYDIITLWHVLEHVHDFPGILHKFHTLIDDPGILIIAVPMPNSTDAQHYKEYWAALDVPRHLYHFTDKTLTKACHDAGFSLVQKQPMVFDSYYVSLLSEQHMGSRIAFPKALYYGSVSNIKALLNKTPWSSEIFVFQKRSVT